ncbi:MAG: alpha/beta hydrolase [Burkholderiaceae bacterium]
MADLRGASLLAFGALAGVSRLVQDMHTTIERRPAPIGALPILPARGITGLVYRSVHDGLRLTGAGTNAVLAPFEQILASGERTRKREALVAIVNGLYGDHLDRTGNPLAIEMSLRYQQRAIDVANPGESLRSAGSPPASSRLLILVHGLFMNDLKWSRDGHDHGAALAAELGYSVLYLHYNSGLHIHDNGRQLANLLEQLVENWPVAVDEVSIIGHSMGGLVAHSACMHAEQHEQTWIERSSRLIFLGAPLLGAPLVRGGHLLDVLLDQSPYSAPLARVRKLRSAGIKDLRHGVVSAEPLTQASLPRGVKCYAAATTRGDRQGLLADKLIGDGLVPVDSALGRHSDPAKTLPIPESQQWVGQGISHLEMLSSPQVYARLRDWLGERVPKARTVG